jgi:hypothetical protein
MLARQLESQDKKRDMAVSAMDSQLSTNERFHKHNMKPVIDQPEKNIAILEGTPNTGNHHGSSLLHSSTDRTERSDDGALNI